jgi:hypothetical protein
MGHSSNQRNVRLWLDALEVCLKAPIKRGVTTEAANMLLAG